MTNNPTSNRLVSIDFLRGFTIAVMILVNNPGSWSYVFPPLSHSQWHGCTPTDLVFPMFLFLVGFSVVLSFSKIKLNPDKSDAIKKITIRSIKLFGVGLFLNLIPYFSLVDLRIMGVLQRIAIVFFVSSLAYLFLDTEKLILLTLCLVVTYYVAMMFIPFPNESNDRLAMGNNLASYLDQFVLNGHMWKISKTWDPEGLFSTLPAIASGLIGVLNGIYFQREKNNLFKYINITVLLGSALLLLGLVWSQYFPLNKSLWTSSFVFVTSGICMIIMSICFYVFELKKQTAITPPFIAFGSNAIVAYFLSEVTSAIAYTIPIDGGNFKHWVFTHLFSSWLPVFVASLAMAIIWVILCFVPIFVMYKKKIFVKI